MHPEGGVGALVVLSLYVSWSPTLMEHVTANGEPLRILIFIAQMPRLESYIISM